MFLRNWVIYKKLLHASSKGWGKQEKKREESFLERKLKEKGKDY